MVLFYVCLCRGEDTPTYGMVVSSDMERVGRVCFYVLMFPALIPIYTMVPMKKAIVAITNNSIINPLFLLMFSVQQV